MNAPYDGDRGQGAGGAGSSSGPPVPPRAGQEGEAPDPYLQHAYDHDPYRAQDLAAQDPVAEAMYLSLFAEHRVRGVLITPTGTSSEQLDALRRNGIPHVYVDRVAADDERHAVVDLERVDDVRIALVQVDRSRVHRGVCCGSIHGAEQPPGAELDDAHR